METATPECLATGCALFHVEHPNAAAIGVGRPTPDRWTTTRTGLQDGDSDRKRRRSRDRRMPGHPQRHVQAETSNAGSATFHVEHPHAGGTATGDRGTRRRSPADGAERAAIEALAALRQSPPAVAAGAGATGHFTNPLGAGAVLRPRLLAIR